MKKRLIVSGVMVLCIVLLCVCIGFFHNLINPNRVEKIVLHTYDHRDYGEAELTEEEERKLITLYNRSRYAGEINAEPCCDAYGFYVYFDDGSRFYVGQGVKSKVIVRSESGDPYYLENQPLIDYIYELTEKYDLPID